MTQLAFDLDEMIREQEALARPEWAGPAPLHFTTEYFTVAELAAAWEEYIARNGHFGSYIWSHMWHLNDYHEPHTNPFFHDFAELSTDLRCDRNEHRRRDCECVGGMVTRIQCDQCRWMHLGDREEGVMAWHDHALPGWRDLPVVPEKAKDAKKWALEHYPDEWKIPGAPIITPRGPMGSRSVPGRSPWGGFDIASWWLDPEHLFDYDLAKAAGQIPPWPHEKGTTDG
jgi:hypothetical protein